MTFHLLFPAAGVGRRFGRTLPKQYTQLDGKTILEWTLELWQPIPITGQRLLILGPEDDHGRSLAERFPDLTCVDGGMERSDSVLLGLNALEADDDDWVMVHDIVRPCVRRDDIEKLREHCLSMARGCLLASRLKDTIKRVRQGHLTTLDRGELWAALTPQCFRYGQLKDSLEQALDSNRPITDEAAAMEAAGYVVDLVEGAEDNVKLTRVEDLALVQFYLTQQGRLAPNDDTRRHL